ncbi:MAG TPA: alpha/beta hydrolase, partial [Stellaceae bacterium]|nr:alpha/beta hydrolase [Stellaceae bacterium]
MIDEALEVEYNIRRRHPESPQHYARYAADSAAARATLRGAIDLRYGGAPGETLDFFVAATANAPLFLFIHGGYWRALDKSDFSFIAPPFVAAGIAVTLINYDLTPKVTVETIVAQTQRAIRWIHENQALSFDRRRLIVGGHSAGGQLTAMALAAELRLPIAAGIALSGVFDLVPLLKTNVNVQL